MVLAQHFWGKICSRSASELLLSGQLASEEVVYYCAVLAFGILHQRIFPSFDSILRPDFVQSVSYLPAENFHRFHFYLNLFHYWNNIQILYNSCRLFPIHFHANQSDPLILSLSKIEVRALFDHMKLAAGTLDFNSRLAAENWYRAQNL